MPWPRSPLGQPRQRLNELTSDLFQAGPQFQRLFVLVDIPAVRIVVRERQRITLGVRIRPLTEARRRHIFGVSG